MRALHASGLTQQEVGAMFGVPRSSMAKLLPSGAKQKKLSTDQVAEIRARHAAGESQAQLRAEFGVAKSTMSNIIKRGS